MQASFDDNNSNIIYRFNIFLPWMNHKLLTRVIETGGPNMSRRREGPHKLPR